MDADYRDTSCLVWGYARRESGVRRTVQPRGIAGWRVGDALLRAASNLSLVREQALGGADAWYTFCEVERPACWGGDSYDCSTRASNPPWTRQGVVGRQSAQVFPITPWIHRCL